MSVASKRSVHVKTFGCQMNVYDSDQMSAELQQKGFALQTDPREADVILINTCSIRDKAEQKVLTLLGQLKGLKQKHPQKVIGITGCVGQRMGRTLLQKVPHLDMVLGPDSVSRISEYVEDVLQTGRRLVMTSFDSQKERRYSQPTHVQSAKPSEYLTIMKGCDHFCSYCIVPFVRGREKSRSVEEILTDVKSLVSRGSREVIFLGQNINSYGKGSGETLANLIEQADRIEGLQRIRYVTSHPYDLGNDLIRQFGSVGKLCPQLHLPFQSGSNKVLKQMLRLYTREQYLEKVEALRKACPGLALSTDVIVGFPGESDTDFEQTLELIKSVGFSQAFLFKYSPRPGTRAIAYQGQQVPEVLKSERLKRVQQACFDFIEKENKSLIGSKQQVLVEALDKKDQYYTGRTLSNKIVHVTNVDNACVGKCIEVEITQGTGSSLRGYYLGAPRINRRYNEAVSQPV